MLGKILPKPLRASYRAKVYLTVFLVFVLTTSFGVYIYLDVGDQLRDDVEEELKSSSELQSRLVSSSMDRSVKALETVSTSNAVGAAAESNDFTRLESLILGLTRESEVLSAVYYVNTERGQALINQGGTKLTQGSSLAPPAQERLDDLLSTDRSVSEPFRVRQNGKPIVMVATETDLASDAAVVGTVELDVFSEIVLQDTGESTSAVVNSSGIVVAANSGLMSTREELSGSLGGSGFTTFEEEDETTLAGYSPVEGYGWTVATTVPAAEAYALRSLILERILAIIAVVLLGMAAIVLVNRSAVVSLTRLSDKAREVRDGNLRTSIESEREDEIGELYESFDLMRYSLIQGGEKEER